MKILFIQPGFAEITNEYPPLGLLYLASVARREGYEVDLYDSSSEGESLSKALEYAIDVEPDVIAISLYTIGLLQQFAFIRRVKKANPKCAVIVGGPHATALPEDTMYECSEIDFLVFGEGEKTLIELLATLKGDGRITNLKGICYRDNRQIIKTESQPLLNELDSIPFPAFDLIKKHGFKYARRAFEVYADKGVLITSRGCPGKCEFCFKATFGSRLRRRTPQNVVAEMAWQIREFGVKEFQFVDDLFTTNSKWLKEFFDELDKNGIKAPWKSLSRVDTVKQDDIQEMKKHGCYGIEFGVESGNNEILKDIKKGITTDEVRRAFRLSRRYGMLTFGFFIFGHKKDTHETIRQTLDFAKELSPDLPGFALLLPFPGSGVYGFLSDDIKRDWNLFNGYYDRKTLPLSICSVTSEYLRKYGEQADAVFYGSISFLAKNIIFRRGISYAHRLELYGRWLSSLLVVNRLYNSGERTFDGRIFFHKYIVNRILIFLARRLRTLSIAKKRY